MKKALAYNAAFSGISGIALIIAHQHLAQIFNVSNSAPFWIIGIGLILFVMMIMFQIKKLNPNGILLIIIQDILWVIGSIYMLIADPFDISTKGNMSIAFVALIVLAMATNQFMELGNYVAGINFGLRSMSYSREVSADIAATWKVVSDVGNYHKVATGIDLIEIKGEGVNMIRTCHHGKDTWSETCILWEPERKFTFSVNTNEHKSPYKMFKSILGTWELTELNSSKTLINMTFEFQYKGKLQLLFLHPILRLKFNKMANQLLDNLQKAMLQNKS